jgi:hypothetical protein
MKFVFKTGGMWSGDKSASNGKIDRSHSTWQTPLHHWLLGMSWHFHIYILRLYVKCLAICKAVLRLTFCLTKWIPWLNVKENIGPRHACGVSAPDAAEEKGPDSTFTTAAT